MADGIANRADADLQRAAIRDEAGDMRADGMIDRRDRLARRREYFDFIRDTLVELKQEKKLHDIDLTTATFTLLGMIIWLSRWYSPNGKMSVESVCEDVCQMAMRGIMR